MTAVHLRFENRAAAIAALAAAGISAGDDAGADAIPSVAIMPDGARIDVVVAGGGSGVVLAPTGAVKPGPPMDDGSPGPDIPVYQATPGFRMTVVSTGQLPEFPTGAVVETGAVAVLAAPDEHTLAVPDSVALWQARTVLAAHGLLEDASAAVTASGDPVLRVVWEYGNYISRNSPGLGALGAALGLNEAQIDALFVAAAGLTA